MIRLARLSIRRPVAALLVSSRSPAPSSRSARRRELAVAVDRHRPRDRVLPRAAPRRAPSSARACSCRSCSRGPQRQLDRQGPALVRALAARGDTRVLSAWDGGDAGAELRPRQDRGDDRRLGGAHREGHGRDRPGADRRASSPSDLGPGARLDHRPAQHSTAAIEGRRRSTPRAPGWRSRCRSSSSCSCCAARAGRRGRTRAARRRTALRGLGRDDAARQGHRRRRDRRWLLGTMTGLALGVGYGLLLYRRWREERRSRRRTATTRRTPRRRPSRAPAAPC